MIRPAATDPRFAARLLGVEVSAHPDEVRAAFRRLAKASHPDAAGGVTADLGQLTAAKDLLVAGGRRIDGSDASDSRRRAQAARAERIAARRRAAEAQAAARADDARRAAARLHAARRQADRQAATARFEAMRQPTRPGGDGFVDAVWRRGAANPANAAGRSRFVAAAEPGSQFDRVS